MEGRKTGAAPVEGGIVWVQGVAEASPEEEARGALECCGVAWEGGKKEMGKKREDDDGEKHRRKKRVCYTEKKKERKRGVRAGLCGHVQQKGERCVCALQASPAGGGESR